MQSSDSESSSSSNTIAGDELEPPHGPVLRTGQVSLEVSAHIRALRHIAAWPYRKIATAVCLPVSTVYRTAQKEPSTPGQRKVRGRPWILNQAIRKKLLEVITASAENRRKPLTEIAFITGIQACEKTLRRSLALDGYHRRVARKKSFLTPIHIKVSF